jgi:aerobic carbon-monoxide dehydrogenase large subunit
MRKAIAGRYVGTSVQRLEDERLLTGKGKFIADVTAPDLLHAAFLRSPYPHANLTRIDVSAASRLPGVHRIITGAEMKEFTNPLLSLVAIDGLYSPYFFALATDRVRLVGDPVALVLASSRYVAEDALQLIEVDYEPLQAVASIDHALDPNRPQLWDKAKGNVMFNSRRQYGEVDAVFKSADRVITRTFDCHRHSNQPMETRGCVSIIDPQTKAVTFHSATQNTHGLKWYLGMVTGRQSVPASLRALATTSRPKLKRFASGAKKFAGENKATLKKSDNSGMKFQVKTDRSVLPHMARSFMGLIAKDGASLPEVEAQDIGGAFGAKTNFSREEVAICAASMHLGRSIKWIEDRNEHLAVGGHAREERMRISAAVNNDGEVLGFHVDLTLDQGAYPGTPFGGAMFTQIMRVMMPGTYRLKAFEFNAKVVATNKGTYVAYRGPWAMETWVRERMLDVIARELGMSAAAIRLRNMVTAAELPKPMITGPMMDVRMSARVTLERAIEIADLDNFRVAQAAARAQGRMLGIGIATFHEAAPGPPGFSEYMIEGSGMIGTEPARTVLEVDGTVSVYLQQMPHGQSHETTFAQVAADELGVAPGDVKIRVGNTRITPFGIAGTGGSRAGAMAGGAVTYSSRSLREQIVEHATNLLEADKADIEITDGKIHVAGVPSISVSFADVAAQAAKAAGSSSRKANEGVLHGSNDYDGGEGGWAMATHVCWVEVDLETGFVKIPRYVVVEDCGEMINPAIVEGQVRGGIAQAIGAVLYEKITYDEEANFQSGTFMDYLIPTSMEIPDIEIVHIETPSAIEANYRGVGEGGMIGAPPAITNAIEDALAHLGVTILEQHLPPTRILELAGVIPTR